MFYTKIKENCYYDSIFLMNASRQMKMAEGIHNAILVMGTEVNKSVLKEVGALTFEAQKALPGSLIIVLDAENQKQAEVAMVRFEELTDVPETAGSGSEQSARTLDEVIQKEPERNLTVISLPGEYAATEASTALKAGMNVFIFSDNVPLEDEIRLKRYAAGHGLFVMGPSCGTAVIGGVSLGIMSRIRKGKIGVVGASGSGIQEICVLVDRMGYGISQAIGTGGRDLSYEVGGITMLQGIDYLASDPETTVLVLVSKSPHPDTSKKIFNCLKMVSKPKVIFFLGGDRSEIEAAGAFCAVSLAEAAELAVALAANGQVQQGNYIEKTRKELKSLAAAERYGRLPAQQYLRGLFCGGTHCEEAALLLREILPRVHSNLNFAGMIMLDDPAESEGHCLVDMGDEMFTIGRPHPVIDPSILADRLVQEGTDMQTAVLLFDLLLGCGIHSDPVGTIEEPLRIVRRQVEADSRKLTLVCALCGTDADPQGFENQKQRLETLGVRVFTKNAEAALFAGLAAGHGGDRE